MARDDNDDFLKNDSYEDYLENSFFSWKGRVDREWFLKNGFGDHLIMIMIADKCFPVVGAVNVNLPLEIIYGAYFLCLVFICTFVIWISVMARRLHDVGMNDTFAFILGALLLGCFFLEGQGFKACLGIYASLVFGLALFPGEDGENRYGSKR